MSASNVPVARLPRPNISHFQRRSLYNHMIGGLVLGMVGGLAYWYGYCLPWKRRFEDFMRNYDPYEDFERMRKLGLFQGAPPDEVIEELKKKKNYKGKY